MEVSKISNSPDFQAKMVVNDKRIRNFIKSSFLSESKNTYNTLDKFTREHPDDIVSINFKQIEDKVYIAARNISSNKTETKLVHAAENVKPEDQTAFINLIKKTIENKSFWA